MRFCRLALSWQGREEAVLGYYGYCLRVGMAQLEVPFVNELLRGFPLGVCVLSRFAVWVCFRLVQNTRYCVRVCGFLWLWVVRCVFVVKWFLYLFFFSYLCTYVLL